MIRILHTIDTTGPGGAETVFINLINGLDKDKFQSFVAIGGPGWVCDSLREIGVEPLFVQSSGGFNFRYLFCLIKFIRENKVDVIQSHLLGSSLYCSMAGLICRVPVVSTFHGFVDTCSNEKLKRMKVHFINMGSKKIVYVSDSLGDYFIKKHGFLKSKSMVIYNGVDTTIYYPNINKKIKNELGFSDENILIGAVGNIRKAKGYDVFLKAARIVNDVYPFSRFVIAGQGTGVLYEDLLNIKKNNHLEEIFVFLGFRKDTAEVINNFDIFVLPSTSEGFSISTIEAMACEVAVVVTKSGGPEEIVIDGKSGIVVDCDPCKLAEAICSFIENVKFRNKMARNGYGRVNRFFSLNKTIDEYCNLYSILIKDK